MSYIVWYRFEDRWMTSDSDGLDTWDAAVANYLENIEAGCQTFITELVPLDIRDARKTR